MTDEINKLFKVELKALMRCREAFLLGQISSNIVTHMVKFILFLI